MGTLIALGAAVWIAVAALVAVVLGAVAAQRNRQVPHAGGFEPGPVPGGSFRGRRPGDGPTEDGSVGDDPLRDDPFRDDAVPQARAPRP